jgi:hypothetical protein
MNQQLLTAPKHSEYTLQRLDSVKIHVSVYRRLTAEGIRFTQKIIMLSTVEVIVGKSVPPAN